MAEQEFALSESSPGSSSPYDSSDDDEIFAEVLESFDPDQLPLMGRDLLRRLQPDRPEATPSVGEPIYGAYHLLFPLTFENGIKWLVKIPAIGTESAWTKRSASQLTADANTMRLLKRETTIPLPEVLDFSATIENPLGCPYVVMTFIEGLPLYDVWFGRHIQGVDAETVHKHRVRVLEGVAAAMSQLSRFSFQTGGNLLFDETGNISGIGPYSQGDENIALKFETETVDAGEVSEDTDGDDTTDTQFELPPVTEPKKYFTDLLDGRPREKHPHTRGLVMMVEKLIGWLPDLPDDVTPFVLSHPGCDIQNFLVSEEGELLGILDWNDAMAVPRIMGNESLPSWLTRDWDPTLYGYVESMDRGIKPHGCWEDSPKTLAALRRVYAGLIEQQHRKTGLPCSPLGDATGPAGLCRLSLITTNLFIAAHSPISIAGIVYKMLDEIVAIMGEGEVELPHPVDLVEQIIDDAIEDDVMEALREGFCDLLQKDDL